MNILIGKLKESKAEKQKKTYSSGIYPQPEFKVSTNFNRYSAIFIVYQEDRKRKIFGERNFFLWRRRRIKKELEDIIWRRRIYFWGEDKKKGDYMEKENLR